MRKTKLFFLLSLLSQVINAQDVKVTSGKVIRFSNFKSQFIDARNIDIWLPDNYSNNEKYAVLYMHDGNMLYDAESTWNKQAWEVDEVVSSLLKDNRIDDVIVFNALEKEDIDKIIDIEMDKLYLRVKDLGYTLKLSEAAKDYIAEKGFDKQFGARPLKRAIQKYVEDALAEEIITQKIHEGDQIFMDLDETAQELKIEIKKLEEPSS